MAVRQCIKPIRDIAAYVRRHVRNGHRQGVRTSAAFYSAWQFRAALEREQARAERNGHQITLALVPANSRNPGTSRVIDALGGRLRVTDEAGWFDQSRIGVLMPYTSCRGAWHLIDDLHRLTNGEFPLRDCRVYTYPCDRTGGHGEHRELQVQEPSVAGHVWSSDESFSAAAHSGGCPGESTGHARCACGALLVGLASVYPSDPWHRISVWQRGLDIAGSLLGLVLLSPVLLGTAFLIKAVSPGPVFFRQMRIGQGARPFVLWKFRTMAVDADTSIHENHVSQLIRSAAQDGDGTAKPMTKLDNDPRVFPLGRILRGACIDELPQLINVLRGEMSLVGPRPPIPYEVKDYQPWQRRRLDVIPGLTGLWQVSGKNKLTFDEMVRLDIRYSRAKSVWMNIMIILRTPHAIAAEIVDVWVRWKAGMGVSDNA